MRRGRGQHPAVSLFAFQDLMASVIGVVFFIVLLLSLQLVDESGRTRESKADQELSMQTLRTRQISLQEEKAKLETSIETLVQKMNTVAVSREEDVQDTITRLQAQTQYYDIKIQQTAAAVREMLAELERKEKEYAEKTALAAALDQENEGTQKRIANMIRRPTITYILDEAIPRKPWLVELTNKGIRAAFHEDLQTIYEFHGEDYKECERVFLQWAESRDPDTEYFVFLIKPSGLGAFEDSLYAKIQKLGFELGSDYMPEDKEVF